MDKDIFFGLDLMTRKNSLSQDSLFMTSVLSARKSSGLNSFSKKLDEDCQKPAINLSSYSSSKLLRYLQSLRFSAGLRAQRFFETSGLTTTLWSSLCWSMSCER